MVFCNNGLINAGTICITVTILILIDGFLQFINENCIQKCIISHNPYFNRWFSAISEKWLLALPVVESQSLF